MAKNSNRKIQSHLIRDINLHDYFSVIKKRLWLIGLIFLITTGLGYYFSETNNVSLYESDKRIIITTDSEYMKTLMVMIKDPIIMNKVIEALKLEKSPEELASQIVVTRIDDSQVISISVTDTDPELAAAIASETAESFKREISSILEFEEVQLLSVAAVNPVPINETQNKSIIMFAGFGLIAGVGLAFFLEMFDGRIYKEQEVEEILGIPVIGVISNLNKKKMLVQKRKNSDVNIRSEIVDITQKRASNDG
ncbi:YveK family protein [Jeotgalibacillus marinus]|uniref:Capsular biosynthesis protein n=1 Tax=Jeotgalibacillus marinus TaxID=86667 RepID=A0ABV3Q1H6_9BACL